ncbi:MAG: ATP-binding protein [Ardenticatenaceae bacterium]
MLANKKVLTVDDSRTIRIFIKALLSAQGADVSEATSGEEALAFCQQKNYDLILLDLLMPSMNGIEVLRELRKHDNETTIVMLTGASDVKSAMMAVQEGADGYIEKKDISLGRDQNEFLYALQQAVERRAGQVAQMQLETIKADFYAKVTHDLRNPTSTIHLALQMLLEDGLLGTLNPEQLRVMGVIKKATDSLNSLIDDYLDFAKIDAGYLRLELSKSVLLYIVESSIRMAEVQARAKQQTLRFEPSSEEISAIVDSKRLKQVFDNLISNAIKYTPRGGEISVSLYQNKAHAIFQVKDTGYGIPPEQLKALFTKYHRIPGQATRGVRGSGLGLLIVKEIVSAHNGHVYVDSEGQNKGSTFTVQIPLRPKAD